MRPGSPIDMKKRALKVILAGAAVLAAGVGYYILMSLTGRGIPCLFRRVTGLKCPGCGVSRMIMSLLRLDFAAAFEYNAVLLCLMLPLLSVTILFLIRYVRTGNRALTRGENALLRVLAAVLIVWGVVRNLPGITFG